MRTSFVVQESHMNNILKFPSKNPIVLNFIDKQFLELEEQQRKIAEQKKLINSRKKEHE